MKKNIVLVSFDQVDQLPDNQSYPVQLRPILRLHRQTTRNQHIQESQNLTFTVTFVLLWRKVP